MHGWFLAHFHDIFNVDDNPNYISNYRIAAKWEIERGHGEGKTYCALVDRLKMDDVTWRSYEEHKEIQAFEEIFCYSD